MKRKSLKLTTLCLALLGAVWVGRPIEARDSTENMVVREPLRNYGSSSESEQEKRVDEAHNRGYTDGYKDGKEGNPQKDRKETKNTPQGIENSESSDYWDSYDMGYETGYELWEKEHPIAAALGWLWTTITSWFFGESS
ncbi:Uncharacterised protein [Streptococcus pyogenes]|uniref:hypothetical protein n=1 Tax=Streptococcus pyogenes TaxID=1314 RepID=UPI0010A14FEC|nr:hypothetical protein [Streptococcus pyogenes]QCK24826.1 hypothetical protein ETT73_01950 [Streptococcus pyogenes]VGY24708.1 Uncharacterised protein [Streptococcus pyogenes]VGY61491.1 Uncharacterised protein [Streptococcus pyogenes]VGZ27503.1 Uncharacterised protein [Streptococcus pyogenes]VHA03002.1 Uncharacterised protein [Streptococcus pyogenes]